MRSKLALLMVPGFILGSVLVGCGSESEDGAAGSVTEEWLTATTGDEDPSPVADYLGFDDPEKMSAVEREQTKRQQQSIVECMRAEGFEYIAFVDPMMVGVYSYDEWGGLNRQEFVQKWGYGISTTYGPDGETLDDAPGYSDNADESPTDPNEAIVEKLSPDETTAYQAALYGDMMSGGFGEESDSGTEVGSGATDLDEGGGDATDVGSEDGSISDFSTMGCYGAAMKESIVGGEIDQSDMEELSKAEQELQERVDADPVMKQAAREYTACMKDAGYDDIKTPDDAQTLVHERMDDEVRGYSDGVYDNSTGESFDESGSEVDDGSGSEVGADDEFGSTDAGSGDSSSGDEFGSEFDSGALKKLQSFELKLAKAELPCLGAYKVSRQKILIVAEEQFIEDNADMLGRLKKMYS